MSIQQHNINSLVSALATKGLKHVVISPGSRNAPLVMAFNRHTAFNCYSIVDERSAGFIALGMAKELQEPVVLLCTSGSAVLNYYPAIVEAFYMQVPLIVVSADRPPELIDRWDGQAIHQFEVFKPHIRASFNTPENTSTENFQSFFSIGVEACNQSIKPIAGPVHINVPLREPLYFDANSNFEFPVFEINTVSKPSRVTDLPVMDQAFFKHHPKILVLNGAASPCAETNQALAQFSNIQSMLILSDLISGKHAYNSIQNWESVLLNSNASQREELLPDFLITTGKMVLNKTIKSLLKSAEIKTHWHIAENGYCADTFLSNPQIFRLSDADFFNQLFQNLNAELDTSYYNTWMSYSKQQTLQVGLLDQNGYNEFIVLETFLKSLPHVPINLHISNSMSIRLAAYKAECIYSEWNIYSNRGVSGIDGCSSTAIGMSILSKVPNVLITGDLAFFYDVNAFYLEHKPENLKVLLLNNQGGGIFKNIEGPKDMRESDPYLFTPHQLNAKHIAAHHQIKYFYAENAEQFIQVLNEFNAFNGMCIFEVLTDSNLNTNFFNQYKQIQI